MGMNRLRLLMSVGHGVKTFIENNQKTEAFPRIFAEVSFFDLFLKSRKVLIKLNTSRGRGNEQAQYFDKVLVTTYRLSSKISKSPKRLLECLEKCQFLVCFLNSAGF